MKDENKMVASGELVRAPKIEAVNNPNKDLLTQREHYAFKLYIMYKNNGCETDNMDLIKFSLREADEVIEAFGTIEVLKRRNET